MIRQLRCVFLVMLVCALCQWMAPARMSSMSPAWAAVPGVACNATMTSITFGNVDPYNFGYGFLGLSGGNYNLNTTGFLTYYCTNTTAATKTITGCFSIGNPGGATQRVMVGPSNDQLDYQLYQDPANTQPWGSLSNTAWGNPVAVNITVPANGTSVPATLPVYATVASNQGGSIFGIPLGQLAAGTYNANYGSSDVMFDTANGAGATCVAGSGGGTINGFQVSANVQQTCQVTTNPLTFPTPAGGDPSGATATTTLQVSCTSHTGYQVGLDNGKNFDGSNRRMRGGPTNSDYISYGLYQNSGNTIPWGNTPGTGGNTVTGTSSNQTFTVYGKVNTGQGAVSAGDYFDAVTVYVYY
ncbi:MAG TPA: spore coat U domain-containing protein [Rhodanobacteraceae bacterium]|nr:spore coat U domain-containing protein [Rhodanobacteraceae bacterium]